MPQVTTPVQAWLCALAVAMGVGGIPCVFAATSIPPAAELQRLHDVLRSQPVATLPAAISLSVPTVQPLVASELREDTRLHLLAVELQGVTQIPPNEFLPLFEPLTGQQTSLAALDGAVAAITDLYRVRGYVLSRAMLPEQEIRDGRVVIRVVEGALDEVQLDAPPRLANNPLVKKLVARIPTGVPITSDQLETVLLQLNDLPGTRASGQLVPGGSTGTATLRLTLDETRGNVGVAFSNHGSRYLGSNQLEGQLTVHNLLAPYGDTLAVRTLNTPTFRDVLLGSARYTLPLNSHGMRLEVAGFKGLSRPQYILTPLDLEGRTTGASIQLSQQWLRLRDMTWDTYGMLDWQDATTDSLGNQLNADHTRALRVGSTLATADSLAGLTTAQLELSRGLDVLGGTPAYSLGASRLRGTSTDFTKAVFNLTRLQQLNQNWNLLLAGAGQFSSHALLAGEEFGVGGERFGRGYSSNEIVGEQGLAGRAELQLTFAPDFPWLDTYQLFGFYDYGMVWNKDRDPLESNNPRTLSSVGYGARLNFSPGLAGEIVLAKPMTRVVQANGDKGPTILFRLSSKVSFEDLGALGKKDGGGS